MRFYDLNKLEKLIELIRKRQAQRSEDPELEQALEAAADAAKRERGILEARSARKEEFFRNYWVRGDLGR